MRRGGGHYCSQEWHTVEFIAFWGTLLVFFPPFFKFHTGHFRRAFFFPPWFALVCLHDWLHLLAAIPIMLCSIHFYPTGCSLPIVIVLGKIVFCLFFCPRSSLCVKVFWLCVEWFLILFVGDQRGEVICVCEVCACVRSCACVCCH